MYWKITAKYKSHDGFDIITVKGDTEKQAIANYYKIRSKYFKIISCVRN